MLQRLTSASDALAGGGGRGRGRGGGLGGDEAREAGEARVVELDEDVVEQGKAALLLAYRRRFEGLGGYRGVGGGGYSETLGGGYSEACGGAFCAGEIERLRLDEVSTAACNRWMHRLLHSVSPEQPSQPETPSNTIIPKPQTILSTRSPQPNPTPSAER
jgi:hypothetical protein